jgi:hypothetical protein
MTYREGEETKNLARKNKEKREKQDRTLRASSLENKYNV